MLRDEPFEPSLFNLPPVPPPPLDPGFRPLAQGLREYRRALAGQRRRDPVVLGLARPAGGVARMELEVFPAGAGRDADNLRYLTWMLNGLLWSRGGSRALLAGPADLCARVAAEYGPGGPWRFERELMALAFGRPFEAAVVPAGEVPDPVHAAQGVGGHLEGCRIGFDLGASDYKVAAVRDGTTVFSAELPWDPKVQTDPGYHRGHLEAGLKLAAAHLPRVDAIGGSSAGVIVDNEIRVASLFRAVPGDRFEAEVRPLFLDLRRAWGVPLEVRNDGDVTALAGGLSLGRTGILGLALGSSLAAGYLDRAGRLTGWLNELAFAAVDAQPGAGVDDWSGQPGVGAAYFSQQALARLDGPDPDLPGRLRRLQARMDQGDPAAAARFETIGAGLGWTLPWYGEFYDLDEVLILGRVTSGAGGERLLAAARAVLAAEFPELAERITLSLPDERSRRVGQAVAAASLPEVAPWK